MDKDGLHLPCGILNPKLPNVATSIYLPSVPSALKKKSNSMHNGEIVLTFLLTDAETAECFFSEALNPHSKPPLYLLRAI